MPRRHRNAQKGGNGHGKSKQKMGRNQKALRAPLTPYQGHARKRL
ncbi:MAG TPA: hypothetical protein VGK41_05495 [Solirubrobacterales bacterium]